MASYLIFNQNGSGLGDTKEILVNRDHVKYVSYIAANQLGLKLNSGSLITIQLTGNEAPAVIDNINHALKANPSGKKLKVTLPAGITIDPSGTTITSEVSGVQSVVAGTNVTVDNTDPENPIVSATSSGAESLNDLTDASTVSGGSTIPGFFPNENLILGPIANNLPNLNTTSSRGSNIIIVPTSAANDGPTGLTTGAQNIIIGNKSAQALLDGDYNVIIGQGALQDNFRGSNIVAIGSGALANNTAQYATGNTAVGYFAGRHSLSGTDSTFLGWQAGWNSVSSSGIATGDNIMALGYQAYASSFTVSNEITLGNSSIATLRCAVTSITSLSDERDKKDITDLEYGLDFIESLQPKQFVWDHRPETTIDIDEDGNEVEKEIKNANKGKKDFGFIAQDVQPLDNDVLRLVYNENPDKLEMSYGKLVPILVKAVKELSDKVKALEAK